MTEFSVSAESWLLGEWIDDEKQVGANIIIAGERACWLQVKEVFAGKTKILNKVAQVHPGTNYYGRGEQLTAEDFMLIEVSANQFQFITKRTGSLPILLKRIRGTSINDSKWSALDGALQIETFPLDKYPLVIQLKAVTPWASDRFGLGFNWDVFGAMSIDGKDTWQPNGTFTIRMDSHHQISLKTTLLGDFRMDPFV